MSTDRIETSIPFSGFYESIHSQEIDRALEQLTEDDSGDQYEDPEGNKPGDDIWQHVNYREVEQHYVKDYVSAFGLFVKEETGLDPQFEFTEMVSPREYNFTTDRIFATMPKAVVQELFRRTSMSLLDSHIRDKFTSYDGFMSYYPNSLDAWLGGERTGYNLKGNTDSLDEWDSNQVGTLLEAFLSQYVDGDRYREWTLDYTGEVNSNSDLSDWVYEALDADGKKIVDDIAKARG